MTKAVKTVATMMMLVATVVTMMNTKVATVVETYDDTMVVEYNNNNYEYTFNGMTEREMYAEKVVIVFDNVIVIK